MRRVVKVSPENEFAGTANRYGGVRLACCGGISSNGPGSAVSDQRLDLVE